MGTEFEMELIDDEILDMESDAVITTGGGGSVTSYNPLTDKPKINGVTLIGNKSFEDLGLNSVVNAEVDSYVEAHKEELKGNPGDPGADGFSPVASVSQTMGGAVITITDKNGTTTANITNGIDGKTPVKGVDYTDGKDGEDGISPAASIERITNGAVITIVDKNGTTSATINDGQNGKDGDDGFSPVANIQRVEGGAVITIVDKSGESSAMINDGQGGSGSTNYNDLLNKPKLNGVELVGDVSTGNKTFTATVNNTRLVLSVVDDGNEVTY